MRWLMHILLWIETDAWWCVAGGEVLDPIAAALLRTGPRLRPVAFPDAPPFAAPPGGGID
jgi:hypothetical protein